MLFINNKYTKWYNNIIASAQARASVTGYTEKHHIIPKSLGGNNTSANLVRLTGREHFICHWLLTKMVNNAKQHFQLSKALNCMRLMNNADQGRYKISGRKFEIIREHYSKIFSENQKGKKNHMYGKVVSAETRAKLSKSSSLYVASDEARQKISDALKGRIFSEEWCDKISVAKTGKSTGAANYMHGKTHTIETRKKISDSKIGKSTGAANHMYGKTHTAEARKKISDSKIGKSSWNKGIAQSDETKAKIAASNKNRAPISDETQTKMIASRKNRLPISEETRAKMAEAARKRVFTIIECQYCGLIGKGGNMTRWHGDKCKHKLINIEKN